MNHLGSQLVEEIVCAYETPEALQAMMFQAYKVLSGSGPEAMAAFVGSCGIEALVTAVEAFKDSFIAVHNAVSLISFIASRNSDAVARFCGCGGVEALANWLRFYFHSAPRMCTDLCVLASLMLLGRAQQAAFTRSGGVSALLDILGISRTKETLAATLSALLSYTHMNEECSEAISSYPGAEALFCRTLALLAAEPALFLNVIVLLYRYTNLCMEANKRLCNCGAVSAVISAMELNYGDRHLRRGCLTLLGNLSFYPPGSDMIALAGGVRLFMRILHECRAMESDEESVKDVRCVLSALYSVLMDSRAGMDYSFRNGLCEGVVDLLARYSADMFVNHYSLGIMSNVLMATEYSKILEFDRSLKCEAVAVFAIRALNAFKDEIAIQNRAINFIGNVATRDSFLEVIVRESGHLALAAALKRNRGNKTATLSCMRAIGNLTGGSEELAATILKTDAPDTVCSILREKALTGGGGGGAGDVECAERCLRTLELFLSYESLYSKFATPELLADVAAVAARYPGSLSVAKSSCSLARKINPEVVQALESGLCTNVCVPRCEGMCPFNEGRYYCPKCCTPQVTYCCMTCSERHEEINKFCVTCWKHHPQNHVFQRVFLTRRCQCDCYLKK